MKIKVFTEVGYKIVNINVSDTVKDISSVYPQWEYVL